MNVYLYTLPFDPRFFIVTLVRADAYNQDGTLVPFDCALDAETGVCYPSNDSCEEDNLKWCVLSPVWITCAWSDVDDGNFAAQCSVTTDLVPLYTIVPSFSDGGEVDGYQIFFEEPGSDDGEKQSSFYGDGRPVIVRGSYEKFA